MNNSTENDTSGNLFPASFFSEDVIANPFSLFAQQRATGALIPASPSTGSQTRSVWIATQFETIVQVLKSPFMTVDPSMLSGDDGQPLVPRPTKESLARAKKEDITGLFAQSMFAVDGSDHRRLRSLVSRAFTPAYIQSLRPSIQQIADELLDRVQDQKHMDLLDAYAFPLPCSVISMMLGVPAEGQAIIRDWSQLLSEGFGAYQNPARVSIISAFTEYIMQLIRERQVHPADDLISQLVQIKEAGDRLNEEELLSMIALLIFAGNDTTASLIGVGMLTLFEHADQLQRLQADLSLVPAAVEELLRYCGPVLLSPTPRFATEDIILGGQQVKKGDIVLVEFGSANHDASQFAQPEELDIARRLNQHVAFGQGIHRCLGAPLARLESDIAFTTLLRRLPDIHLAIPRDAIAWKGTLSLRGISSLPVAF